MKDVLLWAALLFMAPPAMSAPPPIPEFVEGMLSRHPEFGAATARTEQIAGERAEAQAAFDLRLEQDTQVRTSGYYDGLFAEQGVVQPLGRFGAEVFGKYKISDGALPVYEQAYETQDSGEFSVGLRLSLLQNRDTDARRLALTTAAWRYLEAESRQHLALNQLVYRGVSTWLEWYQSLLKGRVVNALVELTEDRLAAIERRVDDGDLAAIALTEYRVTLLQRQLLAQEAAQNLQIAEQRLAYFWAASGESDADQAASLESGRPDPELRWPYQFDAIDAQARNSLVAEHPSMEVLQATLEQAQNQRRQAVNEVLPALDLEMRVAQDLGDGPEYLDGTESIVGLSFSMPLGQRAAKARTAIAEARIRELEYEQLVMQQRLLRDVSVATTALATARDILVTSQQREVLAKQLQAQEQVRFFEGVSDQFLLISREKAALQASMQRIDAELDILRHELVIHATLARLY